MSQELEETSQQVPRAGAGERRIDSGGGGGMRSTLRSVGFAAGEAGLAPRPVQKKSLTSQIAVEDGEEQEFTDLVGVAGLAIPKPDKVFAAARTKLLSGDPRMHTLAGQALGVDGTWPTASLIAQICISQRDHGKRLTGVPDVPQLRAMLVKRRLAPMLDEHLDLFGTIVGRSATDGVKAENPANIPKFRAHNEPFAGMGWALGAGVNDEMWAALTRAESYLLQKMSEDIDARGPVVHPGKGAPLTKTTQDLRHWIGIRERHRGYKLGATQGYHKTGSAMDINYHTNPWMGVRSGATTGGEAAVSHKLEMQQDAIDVIDRASWWMFGRRAELQVSMRPPNADPAQLAAWVTNVWERFNSASEAVAGYFALGFDIDRDAKLAELAKQNEQLVADGNNKEEGTGALLTYKSVLTSMPLRAEGEAIERITSSMGSGRPWSKDPQVVFKRMLPDLQAVAKTMVRGNVSGSPTDMRNPALGLFDLKKDLVEGLVAHGGLHWGGCEFGKSYSGDMMHFDLGRVPQALK